MENYGAVEVKHRAPKADGANPMDSRIARKNFWESFAGQQVLEDKRNAITDLGIPPGLINNNLFSLAAVY